MAACEAVWDTIKVDRVHALIEAATGEQCPCLDGGESPFLPKVAPDFVAA